MKATITDVETHSGYMERSIKATLVGFMAGNGPQVTLTIEEDGYLKDSITQMLGTYTDIELEIVITGKKTTIGRHILK